MASSMKNLSLILALIIMPTVATSTNVYVPKENIALNCGTPVELTAPDNRIWIADHDKDPRYSLKDSEGQSKSNILKARSQGASVEEIPYMTARGSRSQFTYSFRVTPGPKFIRLHFYPSQYLDHDDFDPSKAFFTVKAGHFTLLRNFSAYLTAESSDQPAFTKEFCVNVEGSTENLDITFLPSPSPSSENQSNSSTSYVFINGIEIVSMPETLYYTPVGYQSPRFIGQKGHYGDYSDRALQTVYRLNVGGSYIAPAEDTGMYREWNRDLPYFESKGFVPCNMSKIIKYSQLTPNYTAPANVYRSAVTMGNNATENNLRNLTWKLPVDRGFNYLVRLHFCEFQEEYTKPEDRIFRIYLDNQTAESAFSVIVWSGGNGIPIYKDYVVNIWDKANLFVDLHTRKEDSSYEDAILNGIEVFKMSSYDGNLAGPNPPLLDSAGSGQAPNRTTDESKSQKSLLSIPLGSGMAGFLVLLAITLGSGVAGFLVLLSIVRFAVFLRLKEEKSFVELG